MIRFDVWNNIVKQPPNVFKCKKGLPLLRAPWCRALTYLRKELIHKYRMSQLFKEKWYLGQYFGTVSNLVEWPHLPTFSLFQGLNDH